MEAVTTRLLALRDVAPTTAGGGVGEISPYKGLVAYDAARCGRGSAGRDESTAELVAQLAISRFVGVTGSSGSGKSSLVHAGLVAALRGNAIDGSATWPIITLTPHATPLSELARAASSSTPGRLAARARRPAAFPTDAARRPVATRLVEDRAATVPVRDRRRPVRGGVHAVPQDDVRADRRSSTPSSTRPGPRRSETVVVVLRGDYYGHCCGHPELARSLAASHLPRRPDVAERDPHGDRGAGAPGRSGRSTPDLVDRAVDDASGAAGVLPLLSTAMLETWKRRRGNRLTLEAYLGERRCPRGDRPARRVGLRASCRRRAARRRCERSCCGWPSSARTATTCAAGRRSTRSSMSPTHQEVLDVLVSHRLVTVDAGPGRGRPRGVAARVAAAADLARGGPRRPPAPSRGCTDRRSGVGRGRPPRRPALPWDAAGVGGGVGRRPRGDLHPVEQAFLDAGTAAWRRELTASRRTARRLRVLAVALALLLAARRGRRVRPAGQRNTAQTGPTRPRPAGSPTCPRSPSRGATGEIASLLAIEAWRADQANGTEAALYARAASGTERPRPSTRSRRSGSTSARRTSSRSPGSAKGWRCGICGSGGPVGSLPPTDEFGTSIVEFSPGGDLLAVVASAVDGRASGGVLGRRAAARILSTYEFEDPDGVDVGHPPRQPGWPGPPMPARSSSSRRAARSPSTWRAEPRAVGSPVGSAVARGGRRTGSWPCSSQQRLTFWGRGDARAGAAEVPVELPPGQVASSRRRSRIGPRGRARDQRPRRGVGPDDPPAGARSTSTRCTTWWSARTVAWPSSTGTCGT